MHSFLSDRADPLPERKYQGCSRTDLARFRQRDFLLPVDRHERSAAGPGKAVDSGHRLRYCAGRQCGSPGAGSLGSGHAVVGKLVLTCIKKGISLDELPLTDWKAECPKFGRDIYKAISLKTCVEKRTTAGGPGAMDREIEENRKYLKGEKENG